jgi:hypothetical protein
MGKQRDRITIVIENGKIIDAVGVGRTKAIKLTPADRRIIRTNRYTVLDRVDCRKYPDGKCYYVIDGKKFKCDCPDAT